MSNILPAIIPTSREHLLRSLEQVRFAPRVQIDVVDGRCAAPASWPYNSKDSILDLGKLFPAVDVMVDLMVIDPLEDALKWLSIGADILVVHLETIADLSPIITAAAQSAALVYIAGDDELPLAAYEPWLPHVAGVQLMGIDEIGKQSQNFSPRVLENIKQLRALYPSLPIVIDGSVNKETLPALVAAGANDFVVGSAIMAASNPRAAYRELCEILTACNKQLEG